MQKKTQITERSHYIIENKGPKIKKALDYENWKS
jgi:hypothetical protein